MAIIKKLKREISGKIYRDIVHTTIENYTQAIDSKKIAIHLDSKENILMQAYQDQEIFLFYQKLIDRNYLFYWHHDGASYFIKRENVGEIWKRADLLNYGTLFYSITEPITARISENEAANLIVVFSPVPSGRKIYSSNIADRTFRTYFPNIQKYLPKNTFVLRIMDINLTYGSLYFNTDNYPNMENEVQTIIENVHQELSVARDKVVIYGVDSVGMSALYHGILGNYLSVSTNPYLNLEMLDREDTPLSYYFPDALNNKLACVDLPTPEEDTDKDKHFVISTEDKGVLVEKLSQYSKIHLMKDSYEEDEIAKNSTIEQITFLNSRLTELSN